MIHIGTNPIAWSNDDLPDLGGATPLEVCLTEAREAGYEGIERGHKFPADPLMLRETMARHGLRFISGWYSGRLRERDTNAEIAAMAGHLDLLVKNDAPVLIYAETTGCIHGDRATPLSHGPHMAPEDWPRFCTRLNDVAAHCADHGIALVVHHHMGTVVETGDDIARLMDGTDDRVGLLLDSGHATFAGADPARLARDYAARIRHVHCKDIRREVFSRARVGDWSFLNSVIAGVFTVPGDGFVDFPTMLAELATAKYAGWMVVEAEQDPAKADPLRYARLGHDTLSAMLRHAGFTIANPLPIPPGEESIS
ncbi:MAG TPA: myo-inosose-2 dehydratase [Acidiphilium sp.]